MTGLPQPTVWRLCHTMVRLGYLVPVSGDKLRPSISVLKLERSALASVPIAETARAPMQALADRLGAASGLGARDGDGMVFVQRCESFVATLECELLERRRFASQAEARIACFSFIEGWYDPVRLHSALNYRSPIRCPNGL